MCTFQKILRKEDLIFFEYCETIFGHFLMMKRVLGRCSDSVGHAPKNIKKTGTLMMKRVSG